MFPFRAEREKVFTQRRRCHVPNVEINTNSPPSGLFADYVACYCRSYIGDWEVRGTEMFSARQWNVFGRIKSVHVRYFLTERNTTSLPQRRVKNDIQNSGSGQH